VERRALWIIDTWAHSFSLRPSQLKEMVRKQFECGINAAEDAMSRAYEIYKERMDPEKLGQQLAAQYLELAEQAKRNGKEAEARKCLDSLRAHLGLGAPERVEHSGTIGVSRDEALEPLTDEELAVLARMDQVERGLSEH
jgi:arginine utilization protein RocB